MYSYDGRILVLILNEKLSNFMKARKLVISSKNITPSEQIIIHKCEGTVITYSFKAPQMQNPDTLIFHCRGETYLI